MKPYSKQELLQRVGNVSQLAGVRSVEYSDGKARGTRAWEVYNQAGLRFTVLPDKCMDIAEMSFRGVNLGFTTKNGLIGNQFFNALGQEFLYHWGGGMLATCGLANTGEANIDQGLTMTEHGRIGSVPAQDPCVHQGWQGDDYRIELTGAMEESRVMGSHLKLSRRISLGLNSTSLIIDDVVENLEPQDEEFMLLYHCNFGFPLVDAGSRVIRSPATVRAKTPVSDQELKDWNQIEPPSTAREEQVFYHINPADSKSAFAGVFNPKLNLGAYVRYSADTLPYLVHWKCMRSHDYTVGLEPSNSYILGRKGERENGTLPVLAGYGSVRYRIELGVWDGESVIDKMTTTVI